MERLCVALYARVSSQRQADELTIRSQVAALRQRMEQEGLAVEDELMFLDEGYSGSTLVRPALERLRDLIHYGGVDRVYVHSPDRLARKYLYQMLLLEEFQRHAVQVIFLNHDPQDQSAENELLLQMQGMIAEYERAKILERTRRGRRFSARQGKVSALGHAPYGYRYLSRHQADGEARFEIVADEAQVVKDMFTWVALEGLSLGDVVERLQERHVPTATGNVRWNASTIRGMLCNLAYTGMAKYGKTRMIPRPPGRRPKQGDPAIPRQSKVSEATSIDEQESIPVPAIVTNDLFQTVAERLEQNRLRRREQKKGAEFLLSGLLICHRCGAAYCGRRYARDAQGVARREYYRCLGTDKYRYGGEAICTNKSLTGPLLEMAVWSDVSSLLQDPDRLRRELERRRNRPQTVEFDTADRQASIAKLKRRMARLIDAYENDWLEKTEFESRMSRAKERLAKEQEQYAQLQRAATDEEDLSLIADQFQTFAQQIASGLENADFSTRRKLLQLLVNRVEVDDDEVRIVYKVQPRPFAVRPNRGKLQDWLKCQ